MPKNKIKKIKTSKVKQRFQKSSLETLLKKIWEQNNQILAGLTRPVISDITTEATQKTSEAKLSLPKNIHQSDAEFLLHHPTFSRFTLEDAVCLFSICNLQKYKNDEILFKEGDIGDSLFIIKSGEVKVYKQDVLGEVEVARLGSGTIFGEIAIVDNKPRSANVKTASEAELLEMRRDNYYTLIKNFPAVGVKLMDILLNTLATRLRETDKKIFKLVTRF